MPSLNSQSTIAENMASHQDQEKVTLEPPMQSAKEKEMDPLASTFTPITNHLTQKSSKEIVSRASTRLYPPSRSLSDGYGRCVSLEDEDGHRALPDDSEQDPEKAYEVKWDGDHDPMNPRSIGTLRKWLIVIIVSASSLCV